MSFTRITTVYRFFKAVKKLKLSKIFVRYLYTIIIHDLHVSLQRYTPANGLRHDRHPFRFGAPADGPRSTFHERPGQRAPSLFERRRDNSAQRHAAVVAEHRRTRIDGGRLSVAFAGDADAASFPQILGGRRRRWHQGQGRVVEAQKTEKGRRETTVERRRQRHRQQSLRAANVTAVQAQTRPDKDNELRGRHDHVRVSGMSSGISGQTFAGGAPGQPPDGTAVRLRHLRRGPETQGSPDQTPAEPQFGKAVRVYHMR